MKITQLEQQMVRYGDLVDISIRDNEEKLVSIDNAIIKTRYMEQMDDMKIVLKNKMLVRETVYEKLQKVQQSLKRLHPNLALLVTYGYRSMDVQKAIFKRELSRVAKKCYFERPSDLYEEVHRYIAVPSVAGHPTGGAVDVVIVHTKTDKIIEFGSKVYDFSSKRCYTFSKSISKDAVSNRLLLRTAMLKEGFVPFDGEWWHFSYGDKEWAYYSKQKNAIYSQL